MEEDTKPKIVCKCCSKCDEEKELEQFIVNRNICKSCKNSQTRLKYSVCIAGDEIEQECAICIKMLPSSCIVKNRNICKDCNNAQRRARYNADADHRERLIKLATDYKRNKIVQKHIEQEIKNEEIGKENKICKYCDIIRNKSEFRVNRLKCKHCERDDPTEKFKRVVRCRIFCALNKKNRHTIEYLGCNYHEFTSWVADNNNGYTLMNHGKEWHIDHVIPLSKFNLDDEEDQLIAFNWRNTMPLSVKENLSKNNKIIHLQVEQHLKHLLEYHKTHNVNMPTEFIDLFARHLVAGSPLEPSLPPS
jgi:hypothetical protein